MYIYTYICLGVWKIDDIVFVYHVGSIRVVIASCLENFNTTKPEHDTDNVPGNVMEIFPFEVPGMEGGAKYGERFPTQNDTQRSTKRRTLFQKLCCPNKMFSFRPPVFFRKH